MEDIFAANVDKFEPESWGWDGDRRWIIIKTPRGKIIKMLEGTGIDLWGDRADKGTLFLAASRIQSIIMTENGKEITKDLSGVPDEHVYNFISSWIPMEQYPIIRGYYWFLKEVLYPDTFPFRPEPTK